LLEIQTSVRQADINSNGHIDSTHSDLLEQKLAQTRKEYQELLQRNLSETDVEEVKQKLSEAMAAQQNGGSTTGELQESLSRQQDESARLRSELDSLRQQNGKGANGASLNKQLADFDNMKKSLMRDLQDRCERVIELEINLDSTREQYNSILRSSNSKQQQKKLAFLERNLEQLTMVQRQLVEQNAQLKKEVAIAERKLVARGERIRGLEGLVQESQEKLMMANHKFESQLMAVKERLEAAKVGSTRGLGPNSPAGGNFGNNTFGRIAKPLRGGGGGTDGPQPMVPTFAGLQQASQDGPTNKRSSWFFNQRA